LKSEVTVLWLFKEIVHLLTHCTDTYCTVYYILKNVMDSIKDKAAIIFLGERGRRRGREGNIMGPRLNF
jgi:hypothetical protein